MGKSEIKWVKIGSVRVHTLYIDGSSKIHVKLNKTQHIHVVFDHNVQSEFDEEGGFGALSSRGEATPFDPNELVMVIQMKEPRKNKTKRKAKPKSKAKRKRAKK